jgi:V/A-type H+-transporting ATPase subunit I
MIVKMKKMTLLCTRASREATLDALRDLGVIHLQHVNPPEGEGLDQARNHFEYLRRALEVLPKHPHATPSGKSAHEVVDELWKLIHRKQALSEKIELLEIERKRYELFGSFDVDDIQALREQGVQVRLLSAPVRQLPEPPGGANLVEIGRDSTTAYFVLISRQPVEIDAEELPLPECSADGMARHIEGLQDELAKVEAGFSTYVGDHAAVAAIAGEAEDHVTWLEARNGMGQEEDVTYLKGFFPAEREKELRTAAAQQGWAVLVEDPTQEDPVPTLLRNPKWVKPIKAVLDVIGVSPGYHELDISALFLIFLSIFFAFLIGDAGYGLLFIALTLFGKFKLRGNEKAQPGLNLLLIMSSCTVVWGALSGSWFGITQTSLPAPLANLRLNWLTGDGDLVAQRIMLICFVLGTLHLAIAHIWNFFRKINSWACLSDLGWLCSTATMFFAVRMMVLNAAFPPVMLYVLGAGVVLIILSLVLEKEYFGLVTLVLDVINNFVDIISYVRLYAVGAASFAIANSFNTMAVEAWGSKGVVVGGLIAALCIFLGHALNIVLGGMAILVHGIRLNTLEFSSHAGVQWAGIPFKAFKKLNGGKK